MYLEASFAEGITDVHDLTRRSALKRYLKYMKALRESDYDSEEQLQWAVESMKFIADYCLQNKVKVRDYVKLWPKGNRVPICIVHLKQSKISLGLLLVLGGYQTVSEVHQDEEVRGFYLHNQHPDRESVRLNRSRKFRDFAKKIIRETCFTLRGV